MTAVPAKGRTGPWGVLWNSPTMLLTLTALMFAGNAIAGRVAVGQISPMMLTCGRWGLALIPLAFAARANFARDRAVLRHHWLFVFAMGALGFTTFNALFYTAAHRTGALNLSILQGSIPAFVLIGARLFHGVRIGGWQAFGASITMVGVVTIAAQGDLTRLRAFTFNEGDAMMVFACILYAGYTVGLRNRPAMSGLGFFTAMAAAAFVASIPLLVLEWTGGGFIVPTLRGVAVLLYAALFPSLLAQIFYMRGVELIGPGRAGVFVNLVPAFGALLAVALLGERFAFYHAVALGLVVVGIGIAERVGRPAAARH